MEHIKDGDSSGGYSEANAIKAVEYADEKGIQILNFSLGTYTDFLSSLKVAIQNYSGLFVCSAGNKGLNTDNNHHYPSKYNNLPNLISVGASNSSDSRWISSASAESSNYGKTTVDIFAPGSSIYCCAPGQTYTHKSGTSMAAPFVTGVAALILGKYPNLTASQIKSRILNNAESVSSLSNLCVSGGRLNAYYALRG